MVSSAKIDPLRDYSLSEIQQIIPSLRGKQKLARITLYRWIESGELIAEARPIGRARRYYVPGKEVLRLIEAKAPGLTVNKGSDEEE